MDKQQLIQVLEDYKVGLRRFTLQHMPFQDDWLDAFELITQYIQSSIGTSVCHHIGSTAVYGCIAKPIIDIAIEYQPQFGFQTAEKALISLGFTSKGEYGIPGRNFFTFVNDSEEFDYIHLHAFPIGHPHLNEHLVFLHALQKTPILVSKYNQLKRDLVAQGIKRKDYPEAKTEFIKSVHASCNGIA